MPIKLPDKIISGSAKERIDKFRHTIAPDMAYTLEEVATHKDVQCDAVTAGAIVRKQKWGIIYPTDSGRPAWHLVNPKTLAKHARKN